MIHEDNDGGIGKTNDWWDYEAEYQQLHQWWGEGLRGLGEMALLSGHLLTRQRIDLHR